MDFVVTWKNVDTRIVERAVRPVEQILHYAVRGGFCRLVEMCINSCCHDS
jgi:hypothetical protein